MFFDERLFAEGPADRRINFQVFGRPAKRVLIRKIRPGGSSERKRVSENLEDSPLWLARPSKPKSWMF
jgi:hypothetical protein